MRARGVVVAIDGPAGAGKSTVSRMLADRLGYALLDTGALYRAVALAAKERGVSWDDGAALGRLGGALSFAFRFEDGKVELEVDGARPGLALRTPEISSGASQVSRHPEVRAALLGIQRSLGKDGGVVLEGRDIGTVVFPDAEVKVFLTASDDERARRRMKELRARGEEAEHGEVLRDMKERDTRDSTRAVAPLKQAEGAVLLDSSDLTLDEVVERIAELVEERAA